MSSTSASHTRGSDPPSLPKVVAVVGPTASGKTDIAVAVAGACSGEIIIADSRQIYRGVDISSNKTPGQVDRRGRFVVNGIPYHGLDVTDPDSILTASQWKAITLETINEILDRGNVPVIEGGTALYVTALLDNYTFPDVAPDRKLRRQFEEQIDREGLGPLADELLMRDPKAEAFLDLDNPRRVIRALEVIEHTGRPFSSQRGKGEKRFTDLRLGVRRPMTQIDQRIEKRAKQQFAMGLEREAKQMIQRYGNSLPSLSSIGYLEWADYFAGTITKDEVLKRNIKRNKKLARAQMKWFKRDKSIVWISSPEEAVKQAERFLAA